MRVNPGNAVRLSIFAGAIVFAASQAGAQPNLAGWDSVKRLAANQPIRVRSVQGSATCDFDAANADSLFCTERRRVFFVPVEHPRQFRRSDIRSVRLSRRALSTLAGVAIGAGAGAGIGAGVDASAKNQVEEGHIAAVLFALLGGMFGAGIGQHTDFLAGPLVYQAP